MHKQKDGERETQKHKRTHTEAQSKQQCEAERETRSNDVAVSREEEGTAHKGRDTMAMSGEGGEAFGEDVTRLAEFN